MLRYLIALVAFCIVNISCKSDKISTSTTALESFYFSSQKNASVFSQDLVATVTNDEIVVHLPSYVDKSSLIASFRFSGHKLTVNGITQKSGVSANNFQRPITYQLIGKDKLIKDYRLVIVVDDGASLSLSNLKILKASNSAFDKDISFVFSENAMQASIIHPGTHFAKLNFDTDAHQVYINNQLIASGVTQVDLTKASQISLVSADGFRRQIPIEIAWKSALPQVHIQTEGSAPIVSKDTYLNGTVSVKDANGNTILTAITEVKGRGNSSWRAPKKPYRLKLKDKTSFFGLPQAKNWVLLANYADPTLMLNAIALKMGQMLNIPYTNHFVPVDLHINGEYAGNYLFTEQVEVKENRVNIEDGGVLLELDSYFDETYKFKSKNFKLPVNVKYPDLESERELTPIQNEFQQLESLIADKAFPHNNYQKYLDVDVLANYLLVYNFCNNEEINHPKSTYLYKPKNGKYTMGPIWDFDKAFGYEENKKHFQSPNRALLNFNFNPKPGSLFFSRLLKDPLLKQKYKVSWIDFKQTKLPALLSFIDEYTKQLAHSKKLDHQLWKVGDANLDNERLKLKKYLAQRVVYLDSYFSNL